MGVKLTKRGTSFVLMMLLTTSFFLVEVVVGYLTNSMALVADSFHMLSDIISLAVGFLALKFSRKSGITNGNTFGWVRAGILGALINAVFLVALCLSIFISALKRLIATEPLNNPILILVVGCIGLLVNLLGMLLFHGHAGGHGHSHGGGHGHSHGGGHGHSHGSGHGHSHGGHGGKKDDKRNNNIHSMENGTIQNDIGQRDKVLALCAPDSPSMRRFQERAKNVEDLLQPGVNTKELAPYDDAKEKDDSKSEGQLNMRGVYLHILGDALGSIIVIIAALIVKYVDGKWTLYVDPGLSIIMVGIILNSSVPLLKESSKILLQNVPPHIQVGPLEDRLLEAFPEIIGIHEFHVWQLAGNKIVASVHVKFSSNGDYHRISSNLKEFFHVEGIHSTTFQPEFQEEKEEDFKKCLLACVSKSCEEKLCCLPSPIGENAETCNPKDEVLPNGHALSEDLVKDFVNDAISHDNVGFQKEETLETKVDRKFSCDCCTGPDLKL